MMFGINTTRDILKLSQISLASRLITISKYHSWYLMPNITSNHAITYTNILMEMLIFAQEHTLERLWFSSL